MVWDKESNHPFISLAVLRLCRFSSRPTQKWCRRMEGSGATHTPSTCRSWPLPPAPAEPAKASADAWA
jgi:hypothetical protein